MSNFHSAELNRLMAQQQADRNDVVSTSTAFDEGLMAEAVEIDYVELVSRAREGAAGFESRDDFEEAADRFFAHWADLYEAACKRERGADLQVRRFKTARKLSF